MKENKKIRLAIIGCGAIAENYLNILPKNKKIDLVFSVDSNITTAKLFKEKYGFRKYTTQYQEITKSVDAAIICLPNYLHAGVSIDLIKNDINVLCEKPLATNYKDAFKIIKTNDNNKNTICAIGNIRRYYSVFRTIHEIIKDQKYGKLVSINAQEGEVFSWPTKSGFFFDNEKAGGGVLIDVGSHLLDLILWWLDAYPEYIDYKDDFYGGVESDSDIRMRFKNDVNVKIALSRIRNLSNNCVIEFENCFIEIKLDDSNVMKIFDKKKRHEKFVKLGKKNFTQYLEMMVNDFIKSIQTGKSLVISPKDVSESIKIIEHCYKNRKKMKMEWL